ncbi:flagellar filament outer layer protein FlaA [Brucepastera parasyntrophica]|uniref:flagellar filament outer layer protein FlaA n=1 Tax=Brucepastera parasyntrophica TaxID=2880008 RepID=UPI00210C9B3E|nr:flagellar filament outer layer protein FlaA [Brucepastera parasyntrophica]ULQ60178.1 flagellar filament outer layer protein FlaA [Brucepastera parasyntrophica]
MKKIVFSAALILFASMVFAQQTSETMNVDAANPAYIGVDSAQQVLKEVSVDKFEYEGSWTAYMSPDDGIIAARLFDGSPSGKQPIPDEEGMNIPDDKVLGVKVDYLRRSYSSFTVTSVKPLPVEGITKTVSVWVVGRNFNHTLKLLLQDYWGTRFELYMGKLNHSGWKLMTVAIPPQNPDGKNGIVQKDYHYSTRLGLKIVGFKIECDPEDAYGSYYMYFDDLRAVSDLYEIDTRDPDDMYDNW